jgi:hypothetical protein
VSWRNRFEEETLKKFQNDKSILAHFLIFGKIELTENFYSVIIKASKKGAVKALLKFSKRRRRKKNVRNV